ncbi:hypothetical protein AB0N73_13635 [Microbacterium sp. NPDC089189]|uniref:hypothetical protein n=1 Tax=Microbacterium sp. NPDC089189 TaxID=3154972 RepID=UPI00344548B0
MSDQIDFSVIFDHFVKDAAKWRDIGAVVDGARQTGSGVETVPTAVTDGISYAAGFSTQYNTLAAWTVAYLQDGRDAMEAIAVALEDTRTEYLDSDEYAQWKSQNP